MATLLESWSLLLSIVQTKNFKFAWHDVISNFFVGVILCLFHSYNLYVCCILNTYVHEEILVRLLNLLSVIL
jgi:hypothetical protein